MNDIFCDQTFEIINDKSQNFQWHVLATTSSIRTLKSSGEDPQYHVISFLPDADQEDVG